MTQFNVTQSYCPIDHYPDLQSAWERWMKDDPEMEPFPGYTKALEDHLENSNYHDWMNLPSNLEMVVECTPLPADEKLKLFKRLCNAIYNLDILDYVY